MKSFEDLAFQIGHMVVLMSTCRFVSTRSQGHSLTQDSYGMAIS